MTDTQKCAPCRQIFIVSDGTAITPWLTEQEVAYSAEDGLPKETRKGVAYHAIVNPYDYLTTAGESLIS